MKKLFFFLFVSLIFGLIVFYVYNRFSNTKPKIKSPISQKTLLTPSPSFQIEKAPTEALIGRILIMEGEVLWESRIASQPAKLKQPTALQQGEKIITGNDGKITIRFAKDTDIVVKPQSSLNFAQTLPANLVLVQEKGTVEYSQDSDSLPLSVRVRHLLVRFNSGKMTITALEDNPYVTVSLEQGTAQAAYNDINYISQKITVGSGETLIFDDDTRTSRTQ